MGVFYRSLSLWPRVRGWASLSHLLIGRLFVYDRNGRVLHSMRGCVDASVTQV